MLRGEADRAAGPAARQRRKKAGKLDSPFLPAPVNCALVTQEEGFGLLWNRHEPAEPEQVA